MTSTDMETPHGEVDLGLDQQQKFLWISILNGFANF